jgi:3beta-hydroxy-delta5-steroid dehydrogenase / steroid delta-isomerase
MQRQTTLLVTGAAGFLGQSLLDLLCEAGTAAFPKPLALGEIRALDLEPVETPQRCDTPIQTIVGDIRDGDTMRRACEGVDVVIHSAAIIDWGQHPKELVETVNVEGTVNVIEACRQNNVAALVAISTEDVVYGGRPIRDGDESLPYPRRHANVYCSSKAEAERRALAADGAPTSAGGALRSLAIRPCGIYGERDPFHLPALLNAAKKTGWIVEAGSGRSRCSHVYVGNVAWASLLAARALLEQPEVVAGKPYFITDSAPENFYDFFRPLIDALGHDHRSTLSIPYPLLWSAGLAAETLAWALSPVIRFAPDVTRFAANLTCRDFYFRSLWAEERLGYQPRFSKQEAFARTLDWFSRVS